MTPQKKKLRFVLSYMSGFGLLVSAGIHIATFRAINLEEHYPFIFVLHLLTIASVFFLFVVLRLEKRSATELNQSMLKSVWPWGLSILLGLYAGFSFLKAAPHLGTFAESKGEFVMLNRSTVVQTFPDRDSFEEAKRIAGVMSTRYFSGLWLAVFGSVFIIPRVNRKVGQSEPKDYRKSPTDSLRAKVENREVVEVPSDGLLTYDERTNRTSWRLLKFFLLLQVGALWLLGIVFQNGFLLFAGTFISLGFVNYFYYRKQVRDYLTKLRFEEDSCHISVLRGDTLEEFRVLLTNLTVKMEKRMTKGNAQYFLCFRQNNQLILEQFAGIGFWDRKRIQAVEAGFKSMTVVR